MRSTWGTFLFLSSVGLLVSGCASPSSSYSPALERAANLAMGGSYHQAAETMMAAAREIGAGKVQYGLALDEAAQYYAAAGENGAAMRAVNDCLSAGEPKSGRLCAMTRNDFSAGKYTTAAQAQRRAKSRLDDAESEAELAEATRASSARYPVYVPPAPVGPASPSPVVGGARPNQSPDRVAAPQKQVVNCVRKQRTQSGAIELYNACTFPVNYSYCVMEPKGTASASFACDTSMDGKGMSTMRPGQSSFGYTGRDVIFAACEGGAGGGNYSSLKGGRGYCQ